MLKQLINHMQIDFDIVPVDPLLIKAGHPSVCGADSAFVRTYRPNDRSTDEPYIPGGSLKGVIRSYAEKICRSLRYSPTPVCLPYVEPGKEKRGESRQASCGLCIKKYRQTYKTQKIATSEIYGISCPACRLFGSGAFAGRFAVSDGYLTDSFRNPGERFFEFRDGVAVDRITGGGLKETQFDYEVLTRGEFSASLEIRNFERWQIGLIGLVLRDMEEGLVRIGSGKSRGLGRIKIAVRNVTIRYYHRNISHLAGIWALSSEEDRLAYQFFPEQDAGEMPEAEKNGLHQVFTLTEDWKTVLNPAVKDLTEYIDGVDWPQRLEDFMEHRR